jgi:prevent-host-death family protein
MERRMEWQLQTAKAKFSELVQKATEEGPQIVTRRGKPAVVVVAADEFERMKAQTPTLKQLLLECPLEGVDLERELDYGRDIEF